MVYVHNGRSVEALGILCCAAVFDAILLAIALGMLLVFAGELGSTTELLTALHFLHLIVLLPAMVVFLYDDLLYRGIFFLFGALPLALLDLVIIIWRFNIVRQQLGNGTDLFLNGLLLVSLLLLDFSFFATSLFYLAGVVRATTHYGLGSSGDFDPAKPRMETRTILAASPYGGPVTARTRPVLT